MGATILFAIADFVFSWNPLAVAPYAAHRHEAAFRSLPLLDFGLWAEAINGLVASLSFRWIEPALNGSVWKRGSLFGLILWGFWVVSGTMTAFIWLNIPTSLAAANLIFGLPKCLAIGCGIAGLHAVCATQTGAGVSKNHGQ
ncbi:MAG: hypothetical protein HY552_01065 [Elusimicrobia bacterium]|nr:hypothetical protein [Elusimicrobiota bacterium]